MLNCISHVAALSIAAYGHYAGGARLRPSAAPTMRMPDGVLDLLPAEVRYNAIFSQAAEFNWNAFAKCYPSEDAAVEALKTTVAVILPYGADSPVSGFLEMSMAVDRSENIAGSFEVLKEKFDGDDAEVLQVINKNPGVLGCVPEALEQASAGDIKRAASFAGGVNSLLSPARSFLQSLPGWDEGKAKMEEKKDAAAEEDKAPAWDPLNFSGKASSDDDDDEQLFFPEIVYDDVSYLYDLKGDYNGIEHVLLTMEGEPCGIWNTETMEPEEVIFTDPEEDEE